MSKRKFNVAVAGATGAVGNQMIECLEERNFPVKSIKFLASSRSAGRTLRFRGDSVPVEEMTRKSFKGIDIALFSAGGGTSLEFSPVAAKAGCVVIDNSSAWRMDPDVPLVVPEVNPHAVAYYKKKGIIATCISYPVKMNQFIVRITVSVNHTPDQIEELLETLKKWKLPHGTPSN